MCDRWGSQFGSIGNLCDREDGRHLAPEIQPLHTVLAVQINFLELSRPQLNHLRALPHQSVRAGDSHAPDFVSEVRCCHPRDQLLVSRQTT